MAFSIFFTTGFIKSIPRDLEDSARIDGCSNVKVFFKIILPLLKPVTVTIIVFLTLFIWNDFIYPFYFLRTTSQYTLVLGLYSFFSSYSYSFNWHLIFADLVLVSLPLIIAYFFAQKLVVSGIMAGAVKH